MTFYNTYVSYTGDGGTTDFSVPFSYLDEDEVIVTFAGSGSYTYTFVNSSLIRVSPVLAAGDIVTIQRETDLSAASVVYTNGAAITGSQLNKTVNQLLFATQEANDDVQVTGGFNVTAAASAADAANSAGLAQGYADDADTSAQSALASKNAAQTSATSAASSATSAASSASDTAALLAAFQSVFLGQFSTDSAAEAFASANSITLIDGIMYQNTTDDKFRIYEIAGANPGAWQDYDSEAQASQSAAALSATQAASSASNAANSATNAASSATSASTSASNASTSATNAANSATSASSSASSASTSASNASTSATNAASSATDAATSETNAADSETNAAASEANAATSESNASTSETNAASSATSASTSATNAASSATSASNSASSAASSSTNSANSATAAAGSASAAATSATSASNSATNAASSATSAATSETNAATSESNAATSASNASTSETNASNSASSASTSATNSANSANSASTSASNASSSATAAASAQSAAETARDQALAAYDNFDDRYLGTKTSDPSTDNDGNALAAGALYFNSTTGGMKVYTGSAWIDAYVSGTSFVVKSGDTMTGTLNLPANGLTVGTNQLVASGGNVGIGTNPSHKLDIAGEFRMTDGIPIIHMKDSTNASSRIYFENSSDVMKGQVRYTYTDDSLSLFTNATEKMRITSAGRVSIGAGSSPSYKLEVRDAADTHIGVTVDGDYFAKYYLRRINGTTKTNQTWQFNLGSTGNLLFYDETNGVIPFTIEASTPANTLYLDSTGNVGIGVDTDVSAEIGRAHVGNIGYSDFAGVSHVDQNSTTTYALMQSSTGSTYLNSASGQPLYFRNANSNKMVLDADGNVGINTGSATLTAKLNVVDSSANDAVRITQNGAGNALVVEDAANPDSSAFVINQYGSVGIGGTPEGKLDISTGGATDVVAGLGGTFPAFTYRNGSGTWFHAGKHPSSDYFYIGRGATPTTSIDLVLDNSGNVGIGTTPDSGTPLHIQESSASLPANTAASALLVERAGNVGLTLGTANTGTASIFMGDPESLTVGRLQYDNSDNSMQIWTNSLERMRIDNGGRLVVGHTSALAAGSSTPLVQAQGVSGTTIGSYVWGTGTSDPSRIVLAKALSGTIGTHTAVTNGTDLGLVRFMGSDGTQFIDAASILAEVDGIPGTNDMPGRLVFKTTADGASSPDERMRIDSSGNVNLPAGTQAYQKQGSSITPWINVKTDHGAVGNGSTDDTSAINAAIAAANAASNGAVIFFPPGDYRCNSALSVINNQRGVRVVGSGRYVTKIIPYTSTNFMTFNCTVSGQRNRGSSLECLQIYGANMTGGYAVVTDNVDQFLISDVYIDNPYNGLYQRQSYHTVLRDVSIEYVRSNNGWYMYGEGTSRFGGTDNVQIINAYNVNISGNNGIGVASNVTCIRMEGAVYSFYGSGVTLLKGGYGMVIQTTTGAKIPEFIHATNIDFEYNYYKGLWAKDVNDLAFTNLYCHGASTEEGLRFEQAATNIRISNASVTSHYKQGILFDGKTMALTNADVYYNSQQGSNAHSGIYMGANAQGFSMVGGSCGLNAQVGSELQSYGIDNGAGGSRIQVTGSRLNGNVSGSTIGTITVTGCITT